MSGANYNNNERFAKIAHGDDVFKSFRVNHDFSYGPFGQLVWNAQRLDLFAGLTLYQFKVKGRSGRQTGSVSFNAAVRGYTIRNGTLIGSQDDIGRVLLWHYPAGGDPFETITDGLNAPEGVAVSPAR